MKQVQKRYTLHVIGGGTGRAIKQDGKRILTLTRKELGDDCQPFAEYLVNLLNANEGGV